MSDNPHDLMRSALQSARSTMNAADDAANSIADILLDGDRLRLLSPYRLQRLKRALQVFDSNKRQWKDRP